MYIKDTYNSAVELPHTDIAPRENSDLPCRGCGNDDFPSHTGANNNNNFYIYNNHFEHSHKSYCVIL